MENYTRGLKKMIKAEEESANPESSETKKQKRKKDVSRTGKRKTAVARARVVEGTGKVFINSTPLGVWGNDVLRLWVSEPLVLAEDLAKTVDIQVIVRGGGAVGQAEAARVAIARGLVEFSKDKKLHKKYLDYGRNLLVFDSRRTEPHKPSRSRKGARRHKQRSKR
jgi:small subunit ribosomal protein S9